MTRSGRKPQFLFDKLYLTHDLELTTRIVESVAADDQDLRIITLRYLVDNGLIVTPQDFGYPSSSEFVNSNLTGVVASLHRQLVKVGNPSIEENDERELIGQPYVGDFAAHDGWHPRRRSSDRRKSGDGVLSDQRKYESLLLSRNTALLRQAGADETAIVGQLFEERATQRNTHPVWQIVFKEMPSLDTRAPWEDVLGFRAEARTQHLIRNLRRWTRKIVTEEWSANALEDEVRELLFEYGAHLSSAKLSSGTGLLEFVVTGAAELTEDVVKFRFSKITKTASAMINWKVKLLEDEIKAPGRELALIPEMKLRF